MKVLVTGGAGFIGSHLVDALVSRGDYVRVLDNFRRGARANLQELGSDREVSLVEGDIRDHEAVVSATAGCEIVFHLAAQSNVLGALTDSQYSVTTNVVGTHNVLAAATELGVRRVVFTSSREVYGEPESIPVPETAPLKPKNPYGASKVAGEAYCSAWNGSAGLECQVVRIANVYGTRDKDRVIPLWLDAAANDRPLLIYGGEQILDFVRVGRVVDALIAASERPPTTAINIGSGQGTPLKDLARRILQAIPGRSELVVEQAREVEVVRYVADVSLMQSHLGVEPDADPLGDLGLLAGADTERETAAVRPPSR